MLETIKTLIGITDDAKDTLLTTIIGQAEDRLRILLNLIEDEEIPSALSYIVTEVAIRRFNRIGSEGLSSHVVEGETMSWMDDDFKPFMSDIQKWMDDQEDALTQRGRVKFI